MPAEMRNIGDALASDFHRAQINLRSVIWCDTKICFIACVLRGLYCELAARLVRTGSSLVGALNADAASRIRSHCSAELSAR